ncbi:MAG: hypothetical protein WA824_17085 [Candidatus Sulfotelmatobacter sp.]
MSSAPRSRQTFKISDSLNRQLNSYAQVASAAGVSVLALAGASEAKVVYTETHQVTHSFPLNIDLNHDGIKDFQLRTMFYRGSSGLELGLSASGYRNANNVVAGKRLSSSGGYFFSAASALPAGAEIGPEGNSPFLLHLWQRSFSRGMPVAGSVGRQRRGCQGSISRT